MPTDQMQFEATTHEVRVEVRPVYLSEPSNPAAGHYVFTYHVRISNLSSRPVQLKARHWLITDAYGGTERVDGPGVVGQQPWLKPGETFEYSSFCPLTTPTGSMQGTYSMEDKQGRAFDVAIPIFILSEPNHYH